MAEQINKIFRFDDYKVYNDLAIQALLNKNMKILCVCPTIKICRDIQYKILSDYKERIKASCNLRLQFENYSEIIFFSFNKFSHQCLGLRVNYIYVHSSMGSSAIPVLVSCIADYKREITVRSLFFSDAHLGNKYAQSEKLLKLLSSIKSCEYLYINGDFLDLWCRKKRFTTTELTIIQKILRLARKGTKVYYIIGNHDDKLAEFLLNESAGNIEICNEKIHTTLKGKKCFVFHGDRLDIFVKGKLKWIGRMGDIGYNILLRLNYFYNKFYRLFKFTPKKSLSQYVKERVKKVDMFLTDFEDAAIIEAEKNKCDIAICGHIHVPSLGQKYINLGDFMEHSSYLIEDYYGNLILENNEI